MKLISMKSDEIFGMEPKSGEHSLFLLFSCLAVCNPILVRFCFFNYFILIVSCCGLKMIYVCNKHFVFAYSLFTHCSFDSLITTRKSSVLFKVTACKISTNH